MSWLAELDPAVKLRWRSFAFSADALASGTI